MKQTPEEKAYWTAKKEEKRILDLMSKPGIPPIEARYYRAQLDRLFIPNMPIRRKKFRPVAEDESDGKMDFIKNFNSKNSNRGGNV